MLAFCHGIICIQRFGGSLCRCNSGVCILGSLSRPFHCFVREFSSRRVIGTVESSVSSVCKTGDGCSSRRRICCCLRCYSGGLGSQHSEFGGEGGSLGCIYRSF